jgi:hypothetical protein
MINQEKQKQKVSIGFVILWLLKINVPWITLIRQVLFWFYVDKTLQLTNFATTETIAYVPEYLCCTLGNEGFVVNI